MTQVRKSYFSLEQDFSEDSSILSKLWKNWFSLSLHVNFNYNDLWNGCKVFFLWPSKPSNTRFNYWYNFHSLNYKQRTGIFHCLPTFTLFVLFLTLLMELFSNCAFVGLEEHKKHWTLPMAYYIQNWWRHQTNFILLMDFV